MKKTVGIIDRKAHYDLKLNIWNCFLSSFRYAITWNNTIKI